MSSHFLGKTNSKVRQVTDTRVQRTTKQAGLHLFLPLFFLKSAAPTAARGTRAPKRTVWGKDLLTTLNARNPARSVSNVIGTRKKALSRYHKQAQAVFNTPSGATYKFKKRT